MELVSYVFKWLSINIDESCVTAGVHTLPTPTLCLPLPDLNNSFKSNKAIAKANDQKKVQDSLSVSLEIRIAKLST